MRVFPQIAGHSRLGVSLIILLTAFVGSPAQSINPSATSCPRVSVTGSRSAPLHFEAIVTEESPGQNFSYHWTVSDGQITSGQGTAAIEVIPSSGTLTAKVELKGLPSACGSVTASMSFIHLFPSVPESRLFDEFGSIPFRKVRVRLSQFAEQLRNSPGSLGYIVSHNKWALAKRAISYLVRTQ
ncbi:MAG TPA: hypothetical protein VF074_15535, partial [Pyrinomonadaceae bacterium]